MAQEFLNKHVAKAVFDSAGTDSAGVANTTVAAHPLGVFIPANAVITHAYFRVDTAFTSTNSTATIALKATAANDLVVAIAVSGAPWSTTGVKGTLAGQYAEATVAGDSALLDAARFATSCILIGTTSKELTASVAVEALTAGKLTLFVEYVV